MTTSRPRRTRSRTTPQAPAADLERIRAIRDELDARSAEQQQREDQLIAEYLAAVAEKTTHVAKRDAAIAELQQRIRTVNEETEHALAEAEKRGSAALAGLSRSRSAPQLSIMVDLSPKEIRKRVHAHNASTSPTAPNGRRPRKTTEMCTADGEIEKPERPRPAPDDNTTAPPEPATEAASTAATKPEPTPAPDRSPTHNPSVPLPDADLPLPPDDTDRLF